MLAGGADEEAVVGLGAFSAARDIFVWIDSVDWSLLAHERERSRKGESRQKES
jgi:hypothetical protein